VKPPAKNTSPDANDAAAKQHRACPRPAGYVVQLLLVALYMSTYDEEVPLSDVHTSEKIFNFKIQEPASASHSSSNTHDKNYCIHNSNQNKQLP
jgi:hypothetical protein